jgi:hypothetical protein
MDREDASAIPWMAQHDRNPLPARIVWKQDDVKRERFYWLAVDPGSIDARAEVTAICEGQRIDVQAEGVSQLTIRLNDRLLNLDAPIVVQSGESILFEGRVSRSIAVLEETLDEYGDPQAIYCGEVDVELSETKVAEEE